MLNAVVDAQVMDKLSSGVLGYIVESYIEGHPSAIMLILGGGGYIEVIADAIEISDRFECNQLKATYVQKQKLEYHLLDGFDHGCRPSLVEREEWIKRDDENTALVGVKSTVQVCGAVGCAPSDALDRCIVQAGLLCEASSGDCFMVFSDNFPFSVQIAIGRNEVSRAMGKYFT